MLRALILSLVAIVCATPAQAHTRSQSASPGSANGGFVRAKSQLANQMQRRECRSTQSCDVSGVRWNFRFDQRNV